MPQALQLVCFAGNMDGRRLVVDSETVPDGNGGVYYRYSFQHRSKKKQILIHQSVNRDKLSKDILYKATQ